MFVMFDMVCTPAIPGILEKRFCVHVCEVVYRMYTCKTRHFGNETFCSCFFLLLRLCTHVRLRIVSTSLIFDVCVVVEDMYTYKIEHFGNWPLCLCLCY